MLTEKHKAILLVDPYRNSAAHVWKGCHNYKGLRIHAIDGLHDFAAEQIVEVLGPGAAVLDLGAGSGAMSARLADLGFAVTAMDVVPENFRLHDSVPFIAANLNEAFADRIDTAPEGIIALEILEHLENPRHFVRECYRALKPSGYLLLSTPNVDSPVSKSLFIRYGRFKYFDDDNYIGDGHILPISQWLLKKALSEAGFAVRWLGTFGDPYKGMKWFSRTRLLALLVAALSPEEPKRLAGEILVLLAQKTSDSDSEP